MSYKKFIGHLMPVWYLGSERKNLDKPKINWLKLQILSVLA